MNCKRRCRHDIAVIPSAPMPRCDREQRVQYPDAPVDLTEYGRGLAPACYECNDNKSSFCHPKPNQVKNYRVLENQPDPDAVTLRQNINNKRIRIENSNRSPVIIGIDNIHQINTRYNPLGSASTGSTLGSASTSAQPHQGKLFLLKGGEVKDVAANMPGETQQWIYMYCPQTGRRLGEPHPIRGYANQFSIIQGENIWWVMDFFRKGF